MFKIYGDRTELWQWDLNQKLIVENDTINEVHFCDGIGNCSLVCEVYDFDGLRVANIPNVILQDNCDMNIFAFVKTGDGSYTKHREIFKVRKRSKPADYVYTEDEVKSYEALEKTLKDILAIIKGETLSENQIFEIEQLIVSYFENKTVEEVEE